jgi:hypothetical protein
MSLPSDLQDRLEIIELTHRYCWALDSKDFDLLDTVFLPDATAELRSSPLVGREAIRDRIRSALSTLDATQHTVSNHLVTVLGATATARTYLHSQHVRTGTPGGDLYVIAGRYEDELVRTPDGWRIGFRRLVTVWSEGNLDVVRLGR